MKLVSAMALCSVAFVAGCLGPSCSPVTYASDWVEPGLFEALVAEGASIEEAMGFEWKRTDLDQEFGDRYALAGVDIRQDGFWLRIKPGSIWMHGPRPDAQSHDELYGLLSQVTAAPDLAAVVDDLLAQVQQGFLDCPEYDHCGATRQVEDTLPGPFKIDHVGRHGNLTWHQTPGIATIGDLDNQWQAVVMVDRVVYDEDGTRVIVDAADHVSATTQDETETGFRLTVERAVAPSPLPAFADASVEPRQECA